MGKLSVNLTIAIAAGRTDFSRMRPLPGIDVGRIYSPVDAVS
ncbi:hypothetical protein [Novosphingobium sp. PhB165]|nr:hypothetical protein [Novosphingobium sp. PhB165]